MLKFIVLTLAVFSAGVSAVPKSPESRFIDGIIISAIEDFTQTIRDAGLDPIAIDQVQYGYRLPVTDLLVLETAAENVLVRGLSNIVVNSIDFSILSTRLRFDISLPELAASVRIAEAQLKVGNWETESSARGYLTIEQIRLNGEVRVNIGIISGISLGNVDINFSVGSITSDLDIVLFNRDYSDFVNVLLAETIPVFLDEFSSDISELLEYIIRAVVDNIL